MTLVCEQLRVVNGGLGSKLVPAASRVRGYGAVWLQDAVLGVQPLSKEGRVPAGRMVVAINWRPGWIVHTASSGKGDGVGLWAAARCLALEDRFEEREKESIV